MNGLNKVMLIGNVGADPDIRTLNNGGSVANIRLATSESWKDKNGDRKEKTEWHTVVSFAEGLNDKVIDPYVRKGSRIYVEGQLQTRKWQDKDGADRYSTEIVVNSFGGTLLLLDKAEDDGRASQGRSAGRGGRDDDDRGGGGRGRDDRSSGGSTRDRDTRDSGDDRQGRLDDDRSDNRRRPQPAAFDDDLDDSVPF